MPIGGKKNRIGGKKTESHRYDAELRVHDGARVHCHSVDFGDAKVAGDYRLEAEILTKPRRQLHGIKGHLNVDSAHAHRAVTVNPQLGETFASRETDRVGRLKGGVGHAGVYNEPLVSIFLPHRKNANLYWQRFPKVTSPLSANFINSLA